MSTRRTPDITIDGDFEAVVPITKSYVDVVTGERHIVGVASGVVEDRDGERMSRNAIAKMARKVAEGGVKLTSRHQQDWDTEIGDVVKAVHATDTDELEIDATLPPEGVDPMADKAWRVANTQKVGFSVGGKLLKAYHEMTDTGKRRKVLDAIDLRHVALTKNPSYASSFASAVAKSHSDWSAPADDQFTLDAEDDDVEKDMSTGGWASGSSDGSGGNVGRDSVGGGPRNSGSNKGGAKMRTEDPKDTSEDDSDTDADDGKDLPEGKDQQRHLACPNCGHEFAADMPVDPEERQVSDLNDDDADDDSDTGDTKKSHDKEPLMSVLADTLDALKALSEPAEDVTKTDAASPEGDVEKATTGMSDVEKIVAASHKANTDRLDRIESATGEGFELIAKTLKGIQDSLADMPLGRKSVARTLPPSTGHEDSTVAKSLDQLIAEAPDVQTALKISNAAHYGAR